MHEVSRRRLMTAGAAGLSGLNAACATPLWAALFEERCLIWIARAIEAQLGAAEERPQLA